MNDELAQRLLNAEAQATPIDAPAALDAAAGYAVQMARNRLAAAPVGWKIGLTSPAAQQAFGAGEPMCGRLFAHMRLAADAHVNPAGLCAPRLEGEILLQVGTAAAPDASDAALLASLSAVYAAFEIADSRIRGWPRHVGLAIADNACCGRFGHAVAGVAPDQLDLATISMTITDENDGSILSSGTGAACMGSPLRAYRWLLQHLAARNLALAPGDLILTGALGAMVPMRPGRRYRVELPELGVLHVATPQER